MVICRPTLFCKHLFILMTQLFGEMYFGQQSKNWPNNFFVWKVSKNELIPILFTYLRITQFNADGNKKTNTIKCRSVLGTHSNICGGGSLRKCFCKKAALQMFDWVLNRPLTRRYVKRKGTNFQKIREHILYKLAESITFIKFHYFDWLTE